MALNLKYGFAYINDLEVPYPSKDSGLQHVVTLVDSARNANGVVTGEVIGRNQSKVEMTWAALPCDVWSAILQEFKRNFYFNFTYMDMESNDWITRIFYVGDRTAQPFLIDPETNKPRYYLQCKANCIDTGRSPT